MHTYSPAHLQDWVSLIFGENGEKVTEKGKKIGEKTKEGEEEKDEKNDAEEFLMDQTQFFSKEKVRQLTQPSINTF